MDKVYIKQQKEYNLEEIKTLIEEIFQESGFEAELILGKSVLLKVNLLRGAPADKAITTHPIFVRAVGEILISKGMSVVVADSPAGPFSSGMLKKIYRDCGLIEALEGSDIELNYDTRSETIRDAEASALHDFEIFSLLREVDCIINLPKLKTHTMMTYTGAVKNMFGAIAGLSKVDHHFRLQEADSFGHHLLDIVELIKPNFNLMDGIIGMEGDGPSGGDPILSGIILGAYNPHALDKVAVDFAEIDEELVPTLKLAREKNLLDEIEMVGDRVETMRFRLPKGTPVTFLPRNLPRPLFKLINNSIKSKIIFLHNKCIRCGDCVRSCPAKIIKFNDEGFPNYIKEKCISCFCCHEVCPVDAIDVKRPILSRWMRK